MLTNDPSSIPLTSQNRDRPTQLDPTFGRDSTNPKSPSKWDWHELLDSLLQLGIALLLLCASIVVQLIFSVVLLVPYALHRGITPSSPDFGLKFVEFATTDKTAILLQVWSLLPSHILTVVLVWLVITRFGRRPFLDSLGLRWSSGFEIWVSLGLGILMFGVASVTAWLIGADKPTQLEQIVNSSLAARYAVAFLAVFTAPFVEELVYRGVLYSALQRIVGVTGAVAIVLGLFTLIHVPQYWPNVGIVVAVGLLSVALTLVRAYSGRLLPCVIIHLVFNGIQSVLLIAEAYVPQLRSTSEQGLSILFWLVFHPFSVSQIL